MFAGARAPRLQHISGPLTRPTIPDERGGSRRSLEPSGVFNEQAGRAIKVAVLDTWPAVDDQDALRARIASLGAKHRGRLARAGLGAAEVSRAVKRFELAAGDGLVPRRRIHDFVTPFATPGDPRCVGYNPNRILEEPWKMPDHGLFNADLIKGIAPRAELSVYRVLNDWGMGDLRTMAWAVEAAIKEAKGTPLIINMSLGFAPQLLATLSLLDDPGRVFAESEVWFHETQKMLDERSRAGAGVDEWGPEGRKYPSNAHPGAATIDTLAGRSLLRVERDGALRLTGALGLLDILFSGRGLPANALLVAAAGNDSQSGRVADPRVPAMLEGVLGVSAGIPSGGGRWRLAHYSNADDLTAPDDGITAFGGDADLPTGRSTDAPVGLYSSDDLPGGNTDGLAQWSGTSFATAIASGYAASIWSTAPKAPARAVLDAIIKNPDGTERRAIPLGYT